MVIRGVREMSEKLTTNERKCKVIVQKIDEYEKEMRDENYYFEDDIKDLGRKLITGTYIG